MSTVLGWYIRLTNFLLGGYAYFFLAAATLPYLSCCSFYIKACCRQLQWIFDECDEIISAKYDNKNEQLEAISERVNSAVTFHWRIIQYVKLHSFTIERIVTIFVVIQ